MLPFKVMLPLPVVTVTLVPPESDDWIVLALEQLVPVQLLWSMRMLFGSRSQVPGLPFGAEALTLPVATRLCPDVST